MVNKLVKDIQKIVADRKQENQIREIQMKTEINMAAWEKEHKKEKIIDKLFRWFK